MRDKICVKSCVRRKGVCVIAPSPGRGRAREAACLSPPVKLRTRLAEPNQVVVRPPSASALRRSAGLTLVELLVVVAVVGVLASVGLPNFRHQVKKAKRAEGITGLTAIYHQQTDYFRENNRYADTFDELGVPLSGVKQVDERTLVGRYYTFTLYALAQDGNPGANYQAIATADLDPGDAVLDVIMIENQLTVIE